MQHIVCALDEQAHMRGRRAFARVDVNRAVGKAHPLHKRRRRQRGITGNTHATELEQPLGLAERIGVRKNRNDVAIGLDPQIRREFAVPQRHRASTVQSGRLPHDVLRSELRECVARMHICACLHAKQQRHARRNGDRTVHQCAKRIPHAAHLCRKTAANQHCAQSSRNSPVSCGKLRDPENEKRVIHAKAA